MQLTKYLKIIKYVLRHEEDISTIDEVLDTLKQKLTGLSKTVKCYMDSNKRQCEKKIFHEQTGKFYRPMQTDINNTLIRIPTQQDIQQYWSDTWSNEVTHNQTVSWIAEEKIRSLHNENMQYTYITRQQPTLVKHKLYKWKASSKDQIQNYWPQKFTYTHSKLL